MNEVKEYEYIGPEGDIGGDVDEMFLVTFEDGTHQKQTKQWLEAQLGHSPFPPDSPMDNLLGEISDDQWPTGCPMFGTGTGIFLANLFYK